MKIETKFNVNDLTLKKYDHNKDMILVCEIMEIVPVVCIAGVQVFYTVRIISITKKNTYINRENEPEWRSDRIITSNGQYHKFREDELIPISDKALKIING